MSEPSISAETVRELLDYDPETGIFTWKARDRKWFPSEKPQKLWNGTWAGKVAGRTHHSGYVDIGLLSRRYQVHRVAWLHVYGEWPKGEIDHIDGDRANNRIANLRDVRRNENQQNVVSPRADSTSGLRGVCWHKGKRKWVANINKDNQRFELGAFDCKHEAYAAYLEAKSVLHVSTTRRVSSPA